MPKITALMTSYNGASYIKETIDSVLKQTFKDFVFLIIDDGSTDKTVEIIKSYTDPRIQLIESKENKGVGYQLREATKLITTPYIVKIDSDDLSHPERFALQYQYMQDNPELDIIKCYFSYFANNQEVENSERYQLYKNSKEAEHNSINTTELIHEHLPRWICFVHSSYFAKSYIIKNINYEATRYAEDYSIFYRLLQSKYLFGCLQEKLLQVRIHESSATTHTSTSNIYTRTVLNFKHKEVERLAKNNKELWVYGTGGLGKETASWLIGNNYSFAGFIDRTSKEDIKILNKNYPVIGINKNNKTGVLIAAQPVRFEIIEILKQQGLKEWQDFMVVA